MGTTNSRGQSVGSLKIGSAGKGIRKAVSGFRDSVTGRDKNKPSGEATGAPSVASPSPTQASIAKPVSATPVVSSGVSNRAKKKANLNAGGVRRGGQSLLG